LRHGGLRELRTVAQLALGENGPSVDLFEVLDAEPPASRGLRVHLRAEFEEALAAFSRGEPAAAREAFERIARRDPADRAAAYYLGRCGR
jgi:hypothetical protein